MYTPPTFEQTIERLITGEEVYFSDEIEALAIASLLYDNGFTHITVIYSMGMVRLHVSGMYRIMPFHYHHGLSLTGARALLDSLISLRSFVFPSATFSNLYILIRSCGLSVRASTLDFNTVNVTLL